MLHTQTCAWSYRWTKNVENHDWAAGRRAVAGRGPPFSKTPETDAYLRTLLQNNAIFCNMPFGFTFAFTPHSNCLKFLYLIATLSSLLIAIACNLTVIRCCLMSVVTIRSYETAL